MKKVGRILNNIRLGFFPIAYGLSGALIGGTLNRVMIAEMEMPASLVGLFFAVPLLVSPARVWFGQMSDAKSISGYHRTGYVWIGSILFTIAAFLALQVVWQLGISWQATGASFQSYAWVGVLAAAFGVYGLALSASSTPFAALLVDITDEDNRSKLVSIVWSMLMVGIIIGAITSSILLKPLELDSSIEQLRSSINRLFVIIPSIVVLMAIVATLGVEKKYSRYERRSSVANREDRVTLGTAIQILRSSRQTGLFFAFVLCMTISLFMQDAILEPYGGEVFGMKISETTRLNAFFGLGTLIGIASTGFLVVPRLGKQKTAKIGCIGSAVCLLLIFASGFTGDPTFLMGSLLLFGLLSGILTAGVISLMLDLTVAETAGTFIGAWGLAQAIARGLSTVFGGAILDLGRSIFSETVFSYGLVFVTQAIGLVLSLSILRYVNVKEFQDRTKAAIATVMESELD